MELVFTPGPTSEDMQLSLVKSGGYSISNYKTLDLHDSIVSVVPSYLTGISVLNYNSSKYHRNYLVEELSSEPTNSAYYTPLTRINSYTGNREGYFYNTFIDYCYLESSKVQTNTINNFNLNKYDQGELQSLVHSDSNMYDYSGGIVLGSFPETENYYYYAVYTLDEPNLVVSDSISIVAQGEDHDTAGDSARPYYFFDPASGKIYIIFPKATEGNYQVSIRYDNLNIDDTIFVDPDLVFVWNEVDPLDIDEILVEHGTSANNYYRLAIYSVDVSYGSIDSIIYTKTGDSVTFKTTYEQTNFVYDNGSYYHLIYYPAPSTKPFVPYGYSGGYKYLYDRHYNLKTNLIESNVAPIPLYVFKNEAIIIDDISIDSADPLVYIEDNDYRLNILTLNKFNIEEGYSVVLDDVFNIDYIIVRDLTTGKQYVTYYNYDLKYVPISKSIIRQSNSFTMTIYYRKPYGFSDNISISTKSSVGETYEDFNLVKNKLLKYYILTVWKHEDTSGASPVETIEARLEPIVNIETYNDLFDSYIIEEPEDITDHTYEIIGYMRYIIPTLEFDYLDIRNRASKDVTTGWGKEPFDGYVYPEEMSDVINISTDIINYVGGRLVKEDEHIRAVQDDEYKYKNTIANTIKDSINRYKEFYRTIYYYDTYVSDIPYEVTTEVTYLWNRIEVKVVVGIKYQKNYVYTPSVEGGLVNGVCGFSGSENFSFGTVSWVALARTAYMYIYPTLADLVELSSFTVDTYYIDNLYEEDSSINSVTITFEFEDNYGGGNDVFTETQTYYNMLESLGRNTAVTNTTDIGSGDYEVTVEDGGYGDLPYGVV